MTFHNIINKLISKIKLVFSNPIVVLKFNLSFFSVGIFFTLLTYPNSNTPRAYIGALFLDLWFFSAPYLNSRKKEKLLIEFIKFFFVSCLSLFLLIYFIRNFNNTSNILGDIIAASTFLLLSYYWIGHLLSIIKAFRNLITLIYTAIFSCEDTNSPFKIFFQNISSMLIAISGILATLVSIVTSMVFLVHSIKP